MANTCQDKLKCLQSQCAEIAELNERNKTLLEENAELKRLLAEVHAEMTKLQEVINCILWHFIKSVLLLLFQAVNTAAPSPDSSTDSGTNVKVEYQVSFQKVSV